MRGARRGVGIVRGSVRGIRARIRVIGEATCEAARILCAVGEGGRVTVGVKAPFIV